METRKRTYNVLPVATTEWELHLSRSLADTSSRGFRDLTDFVCRIVEKATIRPQRQRSPPLHRSRSARKEEEDPGHPPGEELGEDPLPNV